MSQCRDNNCTKNAIKNKISFYRKKANINQKSVASELHCSQQHISAIECGEYSVKAEEINVILGMLKNISYDELFETGKLSVYISKDNANVIDELAKEVLAKYPGSLTEYQVKYVIVDFILRNVLFNESSLVEIKKLLADRMSMFNI